ncbi:hypothetical protein L3Q82_013733 [Scortum barcoo]|uniref:Uncharacterized protein n=1 Tax=Scortum barcoo TaxID=214431 RepID=A0ACB8W1P9_9TELE|nr:hypothetical protein L3Q82_013733 [Scortum barcoo]
MDIDIVKSYKYLGLHLNNNLDCKLDPKVQTKTLQRNQVEEKTGVPASSPVTRSSASVSCLPSVSSFAASLLRVSAFVTGHLKVPTFICSHLRTPVSCRRRGSAFVAGCQRGSAFAAAASRRESSATTTASRQRGSVFATSLLKGITSVACLPVGSALASSPKGSTFAASRLKDPAYAISCPRALASTAGPRKVLPQLTVPASGPVPAVDACQSAYALILPQLFCVLVPLPRKRVINIYSASIVFGFWVQPHFTLHQNLTNGAVKVPEIVCPMTKPWNNCRALLIFFNILSPMAVTCTCVSCTGCQQ